MERPLEKSYLESALNISISSIQPLSGGDVSEAALIYAASGERIVVKQNETASAGMFAAEADGLRRLGATAQIRVPEVVLVRDGEDVPARERFIAMEYVPEDSSGSRGDALGRRFGAALARMHRSAPSPTGQYGLEVTSFLGRRAQDNAWTADWAEFYRERRIAPVLRTARDKLGIALAAKVDRLQERMPELLEGIPHTPRLIHGDLWSGNFLVSGGEPILIDPAAYYGHPEHEWAFLELFGGFPRGMRAAYHEIVPLDSGYEHRRLLLQLYHLLVHVDHFGGPYISAVEQVCRYYGL